MIIIVGAGLAGLTCAKELVAAGQQVLVLEQANWVGGRVRTDLHEEGFRLDRGFQVLFSAYPAIQRQISLEGLRPRIFDPGAILVKDAKQYEIADPLRDPNSLLPGLLNPLISLPDKLRVLRLVRQVIGLSAGEIFAGKGLDGADESTEDYLLRLGFSRQGFINNFARPFYGGIYLDRGLSISARFFQFTFKMLASGQIILPAEGMQKLPEQIANSLPDRSLRLNTQVKDLLITNNQVEGVRLENGETIKGEKVVIATESPVAASWLKGEPIPTKPRSTVCLYFAGTEQLYTHKKILLNANPEAYVNNAVLLTNIAPTYAPPHKHLLSATILGNPQEDDQEIARRARADMADWFPKHDLNTWRLLAVYRIPFAQFDQPPGVYDRLPSNQTGIEGLYLAGEYTQSSSIQGAMHSGENAARAIKSAPVRV